MFVLALLACSQSQSVVPEAAIPEVATPRAVPPAQGIPELNPAPSGGLPTQTPIDAVVAATPSAIGALYTLSLSADRNALTIDPAPRPRAVSGAARSGGYVAQDSARGGKIISLENGPFVRGGWFKSTLAYFVKRDDQRVQLTAAGFGLDTERELLIVMGEGDATPTIFAFSADASKPGLVGICSEVSVLDFKAPASAPMVVRKPVIYAYPETATELRIDIDLQGDFVVRYPEMEEDGWRVMATPEGVLTTAEGRSHRYLFWEGTSTDFKMDPAAATLVPGAESAEFLESTCDRYALTDAECGDFVTYWLPSMVNNPYTLVSFPEATYEAYAPLIVDPKPDTVIRLFMALQASDTPVKTGSPSWPHHRREGFTVVEWGGVDLGRASR